MEILFISSEYQSKVAQKQREMDKKEEKTTKAALCPQCKKFHLVASISEFQKSRRTRADFAELLVEGFSLIEVTTEEAKERFGICEFTFGAKNGITAKEKEASEMLNLSYSLMAIKGELDEYERGVMETLSWLLEDGIKPNLED